MPQNRNCSCRLLVRGFLGFLVACPLFTPVTGYGAERLDRSVVAFPRQEGGVYVGWRLLESDPRDIGFDVYRSDSAGSLGRKVNAAPITASTNYVDLSDPSSGKRTFYRVRVSGRSSEDESDPVAPDMSAEVGGYRRIKLQGNYGVQKVGLADLDGDGRLDYVVKQPDFNSDPAVLHNLWKPSPETYKIEAYRSDGTFLWRYDMGPGIETGIWYSPMVVYDVDGDGRAEVYCKAGPKDPTENIRHEKGMVIGGPEFLVKLDGATGRELARIPWPSRDGIGGRRPPMQAQIDNYSKQSRNLLGIAYLDGKRPHLIVERGTYTLIKVRAYDPDLKLVWSVDTVGEFENHAGQGTHGMQVADIDDDGRDEVIIGAAAIDDDGRPLWSTRRGHPDACYVGHIDPSSPGMQIYFGHELAQERNGLCLVNARTGETIWGYAGPTTHIHSNGMVADIDPTRPGMECYGGEASGKQFWLYDARGTRIGNKPMGGLNPIGVWWADGPTKLVYAQDKVFRFKPPTDAEVAAIAELTKSTIAADVAQAKMGPAPRTKARISDLWSGYIAEDLGKIEGKVVGIADCLGDWREELIVSLPGEVRIYSTTIPASSRRVCLLQDRQYRTSVARQTMGYLYPPIPAHP